MLRQENCCALKVLAKYLSNATKASNKIKTLGQEYRKQ
jgi:hypothetical protein